MKFNSEEDITNYLNSEPDCKLYMNTTIDVDSYTIKNNDTTLYYSTTISKNTVFTIPEDTTFIIKQKLINYGTIINNGRLIIDNKYIIGGCLSNYGEIISHGSLENYSVLENNDEGKILSIDIINNSILNNEGVLRCEKMFTNKGILNNSNQITIHGKLFNAYIVHNKKSDKPDAFIKSYGKIVNNHIIHNEGLINNIYFNAFYNTSIIINTGTIINTEYNNKEVIYSS